MSQTLVTTAALCALSLVVSSPAFADNGPSPAFGQPMPLWGELRPADTGQLPALRDQSAFDEFSMLYTGANLWMGIDVSGDYVFLATNWGMQIWDTAGAPTAPTKTGELHWNDFPYATNGEDGKTPVVDVAVPPGIDTIAALACGGGMGLVIVDTTTKAAPFVLYQDGANGGKSGLGVYAATIGAKQYAFYLATDVGVVAYDLTEAAKITTPKYSENAPDPTSAYPGVYLGTALNPPGKSALQVGGVDRFVITGATPGLDLWDATTPASPVHLGSGESTAAILGATMWQAGGEVYAAAVVNASFADPTIPLELRIYDVTAVTTGSSTAFPAPLSATSLAAIGATTTLGRLTFSMSGSTPFLYYTKAAEDGHTPAMESQRPSALFDVHDPTAPRDVTPPDQTIGGQATTYWGWPVQYGWVRPIAGKFIGPVFYQAAQGIFDVQVWSPPSATTTGSGGAGGGGAGGGASTGSTTGAGGDTTSSGAGAGGSAGSPTTPSGCGCSMPGREEGPEAGALVALAVLALRRRVGASRAGSGPTRSRSSKHEVEVSRAGGRAIRR